jgi:hypothetical protein
VLVVPAGRGGSHLPRHPGHVHLPWPISGWGGATERHHGDAMGMGVSPMDVQTHTRYGAFLRDIPPTRRAGDYAHASARIVTAVFKRLLGNVATWGGRSAADLSPGRSGGGGVVRGQALVLLRSVRSGFDRSGKIEK